MEYLLMTLLFLTATFLILLVLVQRGRGGGLAGAFGGLGGQSAFGTKAGDLFTRVTIGVAAFWIVLCAFSVWYFSGGGGSVLSGNLGRNSSPPPATQAPPAGAPKDSNEKDPKVTPAAPDANKAAPSKDSPPAAPADSKAEPPQVSPAPAAEAPAGGTPEKTP